VQDGNLNMSEEWKRKTYRQ